MRRLAFSFALLSLACSSNPGDRCRGSVGSCRDGRSALWCVGGVMTEVRCDGPGGCDRRGLQVYCDQAISQAGQPCVGPEEGAACSPDRTEFLRCQRGRMTLVGRCRGPLGCRRDGSNVRCDESVAEAGDPCDSGGSACSADGHQLLDCVGARFVVRHAADTCRVEGGNVHWTGAHALVGEPCRTGHACTNDGRMLACREGRLAPYLTCRGANGCTNDGNLNRCDQSIGIEGEPCSGTGAACSADHTAQLRCRDGVFVREQRCADCDVRGGAVHCRPHR